jgi:uncharacterized membrane protein YkvA (DUF1232 family)
MRGLLLLLNLTGVPRLVGRLMLDRRVSLRSKLILPAAVVYLISPIDLVPDILPALGHIDDILVLLVSLALFLGTAPRDVVAEHLRTARGAAPEAKDPDPRSDQTVIEGKARIVDDGEQ